MNIRVKHKGDWSKTDKFLERARQTIKMGELDKYGREGVRLLREATPVDTGKTAASWSYSIQNTPKGMRITWHNDNVANDEVIVAILLQYGHLTRDGIYIQGKDYINPAMQPLFDKLAEDIWEEVTK